MDFGSVKNVGTAVVDTIVKNRKQNGEFKSFTDFCERMQGESVNKKCIESLIKAGAFDEFEQTRSTLLASFETIIDTINDTSKKTMQGQVTMFDLGKTEDEKIENMRKICKNLNEEGFRVVAICKKIITNNKKDFNSTDEKDMTLLGFIGFLDPPKESAKEAIEGLNNAGIRVMVLTGDNVEVTRCVCNKAGINSKEIITGNKIDTLSDVALSRLLKRNNIFAKLSPIQKARIVRVLKQNGNVVGYMGDGINDSPALTNSDVGISVDTAVDIAKETADIILLEKDLNVLLDGVMERKKNICKFNEIYKNGNKLQLW